MRQFDTVIQKIRHEILKKVIRYSYEGNLSECYASAGDDAENLSGTLSSCCVYKEQAVIRERITMASGGNSKNNNIIEIIKPSCEGCSAGGYIITDACKNCLSHKCASVCDSNSILFDLNGKAVINQKTCTECGKCIGECQYNAVISLKRPCESSCSLKAININEKKIAVINAEKCISCGSCIKNCPSGAIEEKSFITSAVDILKKSENNKKYRVYAILDPSYALQYPECKPSQFISALKKAGFENAFSYAESMDKILDLQAGELIDKGLVISSFCPAFINYLNIQFPSMSESVSAVESPVIMTASEIKSFDRNAKVILIAPCAARKKEFLDNENIECTINFDETDALFDALEINVSDMPCDENDDDASELAEKCIISGNISELLKKSINEKGMGSLRYRENVCNGIDECRTALLKSSKKISLNTYIDASVCNGGCINGSGNIF